MNHEKIIEGLSQAICDIGEYIRDCTTELDLFPTEEMQSRVSDLYAHIFLFFFSIMDWIMQKRYKRLLDSFNQNFMERFKHDIDNIKHQADRVRQLSERSSRAEIRVSRLTAESSRSEFRALRNDIRVGLEEIARKHAEIVYRDRLREMEIQEANRNREEISQNTQLLTALLSDILEQGRRSSGSHLPLLLNRSPSPFSTASSHRGMPYQRIEKLSSLRIS